MAPSTNSRPPQEQSNNDNTTSASTTVATLSGSSSQQQPQNDERSRRGSSVCPDCGGEDISSDAADDYCSDCGAVLDDCRLERSEPGWRQASERRLGPQQSLQWVNAGTVISRQSTEEAHRLSKYNERLTSGERSLAHGLREVRNLSASIELPASMRERAARIYREAVQQRLLKGRSIDGIAAACVFIAARERRQPLTIDQLAKLSPIESSRIRHDMRVVCSELEIAIPPAQPRDFLSALASRLPGDIQLEQRAMQYLTAATDEGLHVGKHPAAVAAAAMYAAAADIGLGITQQQVATAADVSTVTISRQYQDLKQLDV